MTFEQLYSGSRGNLYMVTANSLSSEQLIIECGVTWPKILKAINFDFSDITGCLLTHEHQDHSKSIKDIIKAGIDVYSGFDTFKALGLEEHRRAIRVRNNFLTNIGKSFRIMPFDISHDAVEPFGFIIYEIETKEYMLFATDTSCIVQKFSFPFSIIAIECSYDRDVLKSKVKNGTIHETVARRLLDSHMERQVTMEYIEKFCDLAECTEIHLLHMSGDNIQKAETAKKFEKKFFIRTKTLSE